MNTRVFAPAKINLTLRVGAPRADGMHPLESVVAFADVGDSIDVSAAETLALSISGPFAGALQADDDNLVLRAARALAQAANIKAAATIALEKRLPIASGIGGGSADAAATLRALNALWRLHWSSERLATLAATLGADVPVFFASDRGAYMSGLGETCAPLAVPRLAAVLVNPLTPVPTPAVYRQFDAMKLGGGLGGAVAPQLGNFDQALHHIGVIGNDLEPAATVIAPVIGDILAELRGNDLVRYAGLSGSGATCFALLANESDADVLTEKLNVRHPSWWVCRTTLGGA